MEEIKAQIETLAAKVEQQSKVIATTGQHVLELEIGAQKKGLQPQQTNEDVVTHEDIAVLVGELQQQLDLVEERSIRRGINLALPGGSSPLAPLPDADGNEPPVVPKTHQEFENMSGDQVLSLCEFYQLLPSNDLQKRHVEDFLAGQVEQLDLAAHAQTLAQGVSNGELDHYYNLLARFMGVRSRRGATW